MAQLTKKQAEQMLTLARERDWARALAWPNFPKPEPMMGDGAGWTSNDYAVSVSKKWREGNLYYDKEPPKGKWTGGGHYNGGPLYATESEAYQALYHELANRYGQSMASVLRRAFPSERKDGE